MATAKKEAEKAYEAACKAFWDHFHVRHAGDSSTTLNKWLEF